MSREGGPFPYIYLSCQGSAIQMPEQCWGNSDRPATYLPDSGSRGSSVNASALKSKGSASCRSSIRSLSVLLLARVYLDAAAKKRKKNAYFSIAFMGHSL